MSTQPGPSPQTSTKLWEKQIRMSDLDTAHRQFEITPDEKFQYQ